VVIVRDLSDMAQRIKDLCEQQGDSANKIFTKLGVNPNLIQDIKNKGSMPAADTLIKVAKSFGVSVEYLVMGNEPTFTNTGIAAVQGFNFGEANVGSETISDEQKELNRIYTILTPRQKHKLMALVYEMEDEKKA
jgi:transcriptional regulator with XRE-family HTH domain